MPFPRFGAKKSWFDSSKRTYVPAGPLPDWEELDDFEGIPWYILSHSGVFPEEGQIVSIFQGESRKRFRVLSFLDYSNNGFKCLALISEV